jgi:geranylgeranyl pyrophosphate synthase
MLDTALGEMLDVEISNKTEDKSEKDVITLFKLKTAKYTIIGPMQLGAILGGADKTFLDKIDQFGEGLGIAFQIQDDSLGIFGNEKTIGKSVYSDIEEGKLTLLNIYAEQHCDSTQKQILDKYYGKGKIGQKELEQVRDVFIKTGALDYAQTEANKYIEKAKKLIPEIAKTPEHNRLLTEMADFLVKRKS